jgi:hypothetical protein
MDSKACPVGFKKRNCLPHTGVRKKNLPAHGERWTGYTIPSRKNNIEEYLREL